MLYTVLVKFILSPEIQFMEQIIQRNWYKINLHKYDDKKKFKNLELREIK